MKQLSAPALIVTHLGAVAVGYAVSDKRPVDTEVKNTGFFQVDTTKVLATTVESLRADNKLLVYSYKGTSKVQFDRAFLWLFTEHQTLIVPAVVNYYVDLSALSLADVTYEEKAQLVRVKLPRVTLGDIAFQPEDATTINGGVLSFSETQVEQMRKANYANARRSMIAQAQQPGLIDAARRQAQTNITSLFEIPLRIAGQPNVKVVTTF